MLLKPDNIEYKLKVYGPIERVVASQRNDANQALNAVDGALLSHAFHVKFDPVPIDLQPQTELNGRKISYGITA